MPIRQQLFSPANAFIQGQQARQQSDYAQSRNALAQMELENAPQEMQRRNALLDTQIQGAQQRLSSEQATKAYATLKQALDSGNPKAFVLQNVPDLASKLQSQGVDFASMDDQSAGQLIDNLARKYAGEAGIAPTPQLETIQMGGGIFQRDPSTNELKQVVAPQQPDALTSRWMQEVSRGYTGSLLDYQKELKAAGRTQVNVNNKQETEESKAIGKALGQQYADIQKSGVDANFKVSRYERMSQLLDGVKTGKLTPKLTEVAALADAFGITLDPNIGEKQALQALSNEIALGLRNPSGGAGMPGALSDKDREFLVSMTPGLGNTPEGNKLIIQSAIKLAKRDQAVAKMARAYRSKNGTLEGFSEELSQWSAENPLFEAETALSDAASPQLTATGPNGEKLILKGGRWVPNGN